MDKLLVRDKQVNGNFDYTVGPKPWRGSELQRFDDVKGSQRLRHPLIKEYTLHDNRIGILLSFKVYSLIKGYWSLWVQALGFGLEVPGSGHLLETAMRFQNYTVREATETGLFSSQGEKSINLYFIMVPLQKVLKHGTPKPSKVMLQAH